MGIKKITLSKTLSRTAWQPGLSFIPQHLKHFHMWHALFLLIFTIEEFIGKNWASKCGGVGGAAIGCPTPLPRPPRALRVFPMLRGNAPSSSENLLKRSHCFIMMRLWAKRSQAYQISWKRVINKSFYAFPLVVCALLCKPSSGRTSKTKKAVMPTLSLFLSLALVSPLLFISLYLPSSLPFVSLWLRKQSIYSILLNHKCFYQFTVSSCWFPCCGHGQCTLLSLSV